MSHHPERTAAHWRDLEPELTARQIADLEQSEESESLDRFHRFGGVPDDYLLKRARRHAADNTFGAVMGAPAAPPDAVHVAHWRTQDERVNREFRGRRIDAHSDPRPCECPEEDCTNTYTDVATMHVHGVQFVDGEVHRWIDGVYVDTELSANDCRAIAAAFIEAADELDRSGDR